MSTDDRENADNYDNAELEGYGGRRLVSQSELAEALSCGEVDAEMLRKSAAREAAEPLVVDPREHMERDRLFRRQCEADPLAVGRWVRINGLTTESLNGRSGMVVEPLTDAGRVGVKISGMADPGKRIRPNNLTGFSDDETIKVVRIFCAGELDVGMKTYRWPMRVVCDRPYEVSPISERIRTPLFVTRVEPARELSDGKSLESPWVSHLMVDDKNGSVKRPWDRRPGPVVVWRGDGGNLAADDVCLLVCFIDSLLARYNNKESPIDVDKEVTREAFEFFRADEMRAESEDSDRCQWWDEFNI